MRLSQVVMVLGMTMKKQLSGALYASCSAAVLIALIAPCSVYAQAQTFKFDIPAQSLGDALRAFSRATRAQIVFDEAAVKSIRSNPVEGEFSAEDALARLTAGKGVEVAHNGGGAYTVRVASAQVAANEDPAVEVIVTGTHIHGADPTSPVHVVTRTDIDRSGYANIGDVMRSLPESFSGGENPEVFNAGSVNPANNNSSNASTVNLRGLGSDATLVLVNGHRLSADSRFQGSDISGVPLSAIQRVDVVTDGASAVYGSDAVAGVANIILRRNFDGGELSARTAGATEGGGRDTTYSLLVGRANIDGFGLLDYEYDDQSGVSLGQRSSLAGTPSADTLLQPQRRQSLFLSGGRTLSDRISVSFDGLLSDRQTDQIFQQTASSTKYISDTWTPAYSGALSADIALSSTWKLHLVGVASGSRNASRNSESDLTGTTLSSSFNAVQYGEATADGTLFHLPSGDVKAAVGGGYRTESYQNSWPGSSSFLSTSRHISYAYAETQAPLVVPSNDRPGLNALDLSLSIRAEHYSDLGSSTNPRLGLRYVPFPDLTLRATWGKSFKAPSFDQLYSQSYVFVWNASTLGYHGAGTALMTNGANPDLKPEKSTSWTFGGEYQPKAVPTLKLSATYFNIAYRDRIVQPVANPTIFYSDPDYASFILPAPSASDQAALIARSTYFYNFSSGAYNPATVINLLEDSYVNATAQTVSGVDLGYRQSFTIPGSQLDTFADATWLTLRQKTLPLLPEKTLSGTLGYPARFKARGGASWQVGSFTATAIGNYISGETDTGLTPTGSIASWTTLDANVTYRVTGHGALGDGLKIIAAATNLFDKRPPYAASPAIAVTGLTFDSTNSSDVGRVVSLTIVKAW